MRTTPLIRENAQTWANHYSVQLLPAEEAAREAWSARRIVDRLRRQPLLAGAVVAFLLLCALSTIWGTALGLANFRDVAYPDSSDLLRISQFIGSGHIYFDGNRPPYMVSLYGPLMYLLLSAPYKLALAAGIAPQLLVRLGVVGTVGLCVWLTYLISRRMDSSRPVAWLCALFAVSALPLGHWTTQVRGDFFGLLFSLAGMYLFLARDSRVGTIASALCAGLAPLAKQTFVAVPLVIFGWLLFRRRYKEAAWWAAGVLLTTVGGYALVGWHDPAMLKTIAVLRHPILEYPHALAIFFDAVSQPVVPFALIGAFLSLEKRDPFRVLFLAYCLVAWLIAILTIPQAGGSVNYFWEALFTSAVLAGPGLCELQRRVNRTPVLSTAILASVLFWALVPVLREQLGNLSQCYSNTVHYQGRKARWHSFAASISGKRLLSTIPDVTLLSSTPEMPDPFLNATLERSGGWDSGPVTAQIHAGTFELVVIRNGEAEKHTDDYRGVRYWSDGMWAALRTNYSPVCVFEDDKYVQKFANDGDEEVWLPRQADATVLPQLVAIGCRPIEALVH